MAKKTTPIKKEDIAQHPDPKIDEDFKGYPHGPAKDSTIKPTTDEHKKTADLDNKDGEKRNDDDADEQASDGSANAFQDK